MTEINSSGQHMTTEYDAWPLIPEEHAKAIINGVAEASATLSMFSRMPNMSSRVLRMPVLNTLGGAAFTSTTVNDDLVAGADVEVDDTQQAANVAAGYVKTNDAPGLKDTHQMAWKNIFINAEPIAIVLPIAEDTIADSEFDIWAEIQPRIIEAFGAVIDSAIIWGQGRPASWPSGIVPTCIKRGFTAVEGALADLGDDISAIMGLIEAVGYDANGFLLDPTVKQTLRGLRTNDGVFIYNPSMTAGTPNLLFGQPSMYMKNGSSLPNTARVITGDMNQAKYSIRQDMTYKLFTEGVITDSHGGVVMNLMQQDMVALRVVMRLGWAVANPIHAMAAAANRYPFATLLA